MAKKKGSKQGDAAQVKGFFRIKIVENKHGQEVVVGDSGWRENTVVDLGFSHYLVGALGQDANSKQIGRMMMGTGTAPGKTDTSLHGELDTATYTRQTVNFQNVGSQTARFTATFWSSQSHITAGVWIQNIGLVNNTTSGGTMMAGNSYPASYWATNQDVRGEYEIQFSEGGR